MHYNTLSTFHIWIRKADKSTLITRKHKTNVVGLKVVSILAKKLYLWMNMYKHAMPGYSRTVTLGFVFFLYFTNFSLGLKCIMYLYIIHHYF